MSSGSRTALVALLSLLLIGSIGVLPAPASAAGGDGAVEPGARAALDDAGQGVVDDDPLRSNTTMEIRLRSNGDARWTVTARYDLADDADRAAFVELADAYERGETASLGLSAFREALDSASRATGRSMRIRNVVRSSSSSAEVANGTGRLSLSFTWTSFARVEDEDQRLVVDDAFTTGDGTWLQSLGPEQTLTITPPEGYGPFTGTGDVTEGQFRWEGPREFQPGSPRAVFTSGGGGGESPAPSMLWVGMGLAGLVVLLVGVFLFASRREVPGDFGDDGPAPGAAAEAARVDRGNGDAPPADGGGAEAVAGDDDGDETIDVELLSDEERVERLLERNGGRMKQASIVKETGWSNAKVSQLLSAMEEDDRIDKLRIGRENLISFPDEDVADVEE